MALNDVDAHVKYLVLTVVLLAAVATWHNVTLTEADTVSVGMCDTTLTCEGIEAGGYCIGIEQRDTNCVTTPQDAPEWRRAESECALDAQATCNADPSLSGLEWTDDPNATYNGQSCADWEDQNENFTLLRCEQTFNDITQWNGEK